MKTHELARALRKLATLLSAGPDVDLDSFSLERSSDSKMKGQLTLLQNLNAFQNISKSDLLEFVTANNLPIEIRSRDALRDIVDKVARYLRANPTVLSSMSKEKTHASSALLRALDTILSSS